MNLMLGDNVYKAGYYRAMDDSIVQTEQERDPEEPLLGVHDLHTSFHMDEGMVHAVDGLNLELRQREVVAIVGESGCGKSVTALSIIRLIPCPPGRITGEIWYKGTNLLALPEKNIRKIRGKEISMVFQEPMTSLNPVMTIGKQIAEIIRYHEGASRKEAWEKAIEALRVVQIPAPNKRVFEYPQHLSGGMRQRVMIAMGLCCNPSIMIADEPTTALDVTIQAQIMHLLLDLREQFQSSVILITHDFGIVAQMVDRVMVMYAGKVVEEAPIQDLFDYPSHPYTKGLMRSVPKFGQRFSQGVKKLEEIPGVVPHLLDLPEGCAFAPRCSHVQDQCRREKPKLKPLDVTHRVRCFLF